MFKRFFLTTLLILGSLTAFSQQDLSLKLSETAFNNSLKALIEAGALVYGEVYPSGDVLRSISVSVKSASVDIRPENNIWITMSIKAWGNISFFGESKPSATGSITVSGNFEVIDTPEGYLIRFSQSRIESLTLTNTIFDEPLRRSANGFLKKLPPIEIFGKSTVFPDVLTQLFTSPVPAVITTDNELVIGYTLLNGPRFITAQNLVNNRVDVGQVETKVGSTWMPSSSPKLYEWNTGENHLIGTTQPLLDESNGKNKYSHWYRGNTIQSKITESETRRISVSVGSQDASYTALFSHALPVTANEQASSDGIANSGGNFILDGINYSGSVSTYEILDASEDHTIEAQHAPTNGVEWKFMGWADITANNPRTFKVTQPVNFQADWKAMMSSRLPNWVQNQAQYSGNGKSAVVYKSETNGFGGVWLHTEKNGQKYETGDYSTDYELGSPLSVASTDYNHLKQYFAMFNVVSTVPGDYLLDIVEVANGVITQSRGMANIPALPANLSSSTKVYISGHNPINSSEWGANPANLLILLVDGLTVYSSTLSFNNGLFNTSSPWTSFTVSSPPVFSTNGKYAYLTWLSNGNIVGRVYKTSWQSPFTLFSNSGGNYTSYAATVNQTDDLVLMMIRQQTLSNNKQACYGKRYYSGSSSPVTVLESGMPYGNYTAWSVSVEGNKTIASIGKSPDGESWNYYLWKNDGTSWTKETSPFSAAPARLLHNEVDEYPVEATIQPDSVTNLYALKTNPVTWPTGGAGMAKDGDEAEGFSIVASRLGDTTETWITIDPASIDSIVIDTLKVWSIALKQESIRDYLISQLNRVGSASYTDSSATIRFVPSGARYTFYVVDPSGNKFRIRKSSLDAVEEEPVLSATVSVFPNPFNPVTVLSVTMPEAGHARLTIYNILGQQVASLVNGQLNAGVHDLRFNASNLSSGTYLYRFEAGKVAKTGKLQLMK